MPGTNLGLSGSLGALPTAGRSQSSNNSTGGGTGNNDRSRVHAPFAVAQPSVSPGQAYGAYREANGATAAHYHKGNDYGMPVGTACYAMCDAKIVYAGNWSGGDHKLIQYQSTVDVGNIKKGDVFGYGCSGTHLKRVGDTVRAGEQISTSGAMFAGNGVHLNMQRGSIAPGSDGNVDPTNAVNYAYGGTAATIESGATTTDQASSNAGYSAQQLATATTFTGYIQFPSIFNAAESQALTGQRGMMNDVPLFDFVKTLAEACLRNFMSLPNGQFYAFYPDYFGNLGKHAYWQIADVEILDGHIELSDDALATHVFVVGDTVSFPDGQIEIGDKISTGGVVTIFNAFMADFLNGPPGDAKSSSIKERPTLNNEKEALAFLAKYGARKHYEPAAMVRAPIYEAFLAYQKFCLMWTQQFKTEFKFTFMPELYPGGIVAFPEHGLQCYIDEVSHNCSYESGFTTNAVLSAPSAIRTDDGTAINSDKSWVHSGMIRPMDTSDAATFNPTTLDPDPDKKKKDGKWKDGTLSSGS